MAEDSQKKSEKTATFAGKNTESYAITRRQVEAEKASSVPGASNHEPVDVKPRLPGIIDASKTIRLSDFTEVHKKPCAREAFLTGIGSGFGVGGLRAVFGATVMTSCNWAVGTFCVGSFLAREWCQRRRHMSKEGIKRAVEALERKKMENKARAMEALEKEKAARNKAELDQKASTHNRSIGDRIQSWWS